MTELAQWQLEQAPGLHVGAVLDKRIKVGGC